MTKEDDINKIKNFSLALRKNIIDMAFGQVLLVLI